MSGQTILIIGGGVSGLSAARELLRGGRRVMLLDARPRLGGRICTVHHGDIPVELGAEFIHGCHKMLCAAISEANLATHEAASRNQVFENGALREVPLWKKAGEVIESIKPSSPDTPIRNAIEAAPFDDFSRRLTLSFVEGFNAANADVMSAHAVLRAEYASEQMCGSDQLRVERGYGAFVAYLADSVRSLGGEILNNAVVSAVRWKPGHVEAAFARNGAEETLSGDAAVITLPLGVLKRGAVRFYPALPSKDEAVAALQFGNVVKIALTFREQWWPEKNFGFIHSFDEVIPTWWSDPRGPILTGWAGGLKADHLGGASPSKIEELAIEILSRIFGRTSAEIRSLRSSAHMHDWSTDPFACGAYSYIPVQGLDLPKTLAEPVAETLYFAGECMVTDAQMGTVFGAMESGARAAREAMAPDLCK